MRKRRVTGPRLVRYVGPLLTAVKVFSLGQHEEHPAILPDHPDLGAEWSHILSPVDRYSALANGSNTRFVVSGAPRGYDWG